MTARGKAVRHPVTVISKTVFVALARVAVIVTASSSCIRRITQNQTSSRPVLVTRFAASSQSLVLVWSLQKISSRHFKRIFAVMVLSKAQKNVTVVLTVQKTIVATAGPANSRMEPCVMILIIHAVKAVNLKEMERSAENPKVLVIMLNSVRALAVNVQRIIMSQMVPHARSMDREEISIVRAVSARAEIFNVRVIRPFWIWPRLVRNKDVRCSVKLQWERVLNGPALSWTVRFVEPVENAS